MTRASPKRFEDVGNRLRRLVDRRALACAVCLVTQRGKLVYRDVVGFADLESGRPVEVDSIFQVRSVTKAITAVAMMQLVERGSVALTQPVCDVLPVFPRVPQIAPSLRYASRPVVIGDLLCHVSGLPYSWDDVRADRRPGRWDTITLEEEVDAIAALNLEADPCSAFTYSDLGYSVLGRIIEVVAEEPFERYVTANVLEPLGMNGSTFFPSGVDKQRMAVTYRMGDRTVERDDEEMIVERRNPLPAAGLSSTAGDLLAFHQMMLARGSAGGARLLSSASVRSMTTVQTGDLPRWPGATSARANWGYGFSVASSTSDLSPGSYWSPSVSGVRCWVDPNLDVVGIFLTHLFPHPDSPWSQLWAGAMFSEMVTERCANTGR